MEEKGGSFFMTKTTKATKAKSKAKLKSYQINLKDLLEAGCHFGHQSRRWNPKMKQFIYLKRGGVHIFDLAQTAERLQQAMEFVRDLVSQGKTIVFVGTKRQAAAIIKEEAEKCGMPYVAGRWLGGTITNWEQIKKSIDKLLDLEEKKEKGEFKKYTKKENLLIDREINRLTRFFGGLKKLKKIPDAVFVVDVKKETAVVRETAKKGVKVVAIVDSNADPDLVDYVIPANDDAVRSIKLIVSKISEAVSDGRAIKKT
jgi:small subunit ribosomal protein S2